VIRERPSCQILGNELAALLRARHEDVVGQNGTNREKPVDTARKTK
jgi:hypothetical protein